MVTIYNKSNRPVGIGKQFCLPDKEMQVQDKDAYCSVFDEDGNDTGKKVILPGLKAMEGFGLITIKEEPKEPEKPSEPVKEPVEEAAEEPVEEKKPARKRSTKKAE